ncbi:MAG: epoxyqueuosine reductase QueH [Clostridiales bacterium]|nr:epoxyqueuosine reductase QueH [Clostridiales bacterium]
MFYDGDISGKRILLHACCGPCSLGAIEPLLSDGGLVTLFYYNPCIVDGEFERRQEALSAVARHYSLPLVVPDHDYSKFVEYASPYATAREGGERCGLCMADRIRTAAVYAKDNGFDMYTTTLTVSPHKSSKLIFSIAQKLDDDNIGATFLPRDFKKRDGFLRSCRLAQELGIYRQNFCGCEYSFNNSTGVRS